MNRSGAWARKVENLVEKVKSTRAVSRTILGVISAYAVINISIRTHSVPTTQLVPVEVGKRESLATGKIKSQNQKELLPTVTRASLSDTLDIRMTTNICRARISLRITSLYTSELIFKIRMVRYNHRVRSLKQ